MSYFLYDIFQSLSYNNLYYTLYCLLKMIQYVPMCDYYN